VLDLVNLPSGHLGEPLGSAGSSVEITYAVGRTSFYEIICFFCTFFWDGRTRCFVFGERKSRGSTWFFIRGEEKQRKYLETSSV
jgi:hypothetical protein